MLAQPLTKTLPERLKMSYEEYLQIASETHGLGHGCHVQRNHAGAVTITLYTARD